MDYFYDTFKVLFCLFDMHDDWKIYIFDLNTSYMVSLHSKLTYPTQSSSNDTESKRPWCSIEGDFEAPCFFTLG